MSKIMEKQYEDTLRENLGLLTDVKRLKKENETLKNRCLCPQPELSKMAIDCNCSHSDEHRVTDRAEIKWLEEALDVEREKLRLIKILIGAVIRTVRDLIKDSLVISYCRDIVKIIDTEQALKETQ